MFLAQTLDSSNAQAILYVDILENILSDEHSESKFILDEAIETAKSIALEKKDLYSIDKKYFFLVTKLLKDYYAGLIIPQKLGQ